VLVQEGSAGLARLQHVVDGGKLVKVEGNALGDVLRLGAAGRHAHGDEFAHMADLVVRQDGLLGDLKPRQPGYRPDRLHALHVGRHEG
jgi:hypothetical protein